MEAKRSPLQIVDFAITELDFKLVELESSNPDLEIGILMNQYDINIDFDFYSGDLIRVAIRADINRADKRLPGYSLFAESVCLFAFDNSTQLTDEARNALEGFSTIYIALNSLRGLISNFTANAPFGRYIMPSIDLNDLIEKKKSTLMDMNNVSSKAPKKSMKKSS